MFEVSAHMTVRPGQLEGFKKQAAECIRITREKDTHTLRYDWFLSNDGTECEVREAYTGPEGLIEHNKNIIEARTRLFKDDDDWEWHRESMELCDAGGGRWYWSVRYRAYYKDIVFILRLPEIHLVVLMDGTVVEPTVVEKKDEKRNWQTVL